MNEFKPGDVVQLKSGGPLMSVDYFDEDTKMVYCSWFHGTVRNQDHFTPETLQKGEKPKASVTHLGQEVDG